MKVWVVIYMPPWQDSWSVIVGIYDSEDKARRFIADKVAHYYDIKCYTVN